MIDGRCMARCSQRAMEGRRLHAFARHYNLIFLVAIIRLQTHTILIVGKFLRMYSSVNKSLILVHSDVHFFKFQVIIAHSFVVLLVLFAGVAFSLLDYLPQKLG